MTALGGRPAISSWLALSFAAFAAVGCVRYRAEIIDPRRVDAYASTATARIERDDRGDLILTELCHLRSLTTPLVADRYTEEAPTIGVENEALVVEYQACHALFSTANTVAMLTTPVDNVRLVERRNLASRPAGIGLWIAALVAGALGTVSIALPGSDARRYGLGLLGVGVGVGLCAAATRQLAVPLDWQQVPLRTIPPR